jgi:hypothetical protein
VCAGTGANSASADDFLLAALDAAKQSSPEAARKYRSPGIRLLVSLCAELQRQAQGRPFFLGCRSAGALLGVPYGRAAKWLRVLVMDGVLRLVSVGSRGTGKASEYLYAPTEGGEV